MLYILGLAVLSGILMISVSVIFFKTDIRLYWKEIAMFALLQMTVFTYTPYVFIWWNDFAAGMVGPDKYTSALRLLNDITGNKMNNFDIEHPRLEKRMEYIADAFERR